MHLMKFNEISSQFSWFGKGICNALLAYANTPNFLKVTAVSEHEPAIGTWCPPNPKSSQT